MDPRTIDDEASVLVSYIFSVAWTFTWIGMCHHQRLDDSIEPVSYVFYVWHRMLDSNLNVYKNWSMKTKHHVIYQMGNGKKNTPINEMI